MAGIQCGTTGCHSIKTNPEFDLNKQDKIAKGILDQKSSHFNSKIKVVKKGKTEAVITNFETAFKKFQAQSNLNQNQSKQKSKAKNISRVDMRSIASQVINARKHLVKTETSKKITPPPVNLQNNKDKSSGRTK
jgi:hypothetical protein